MNTDLSLRTKSESAPGLLSRRRVQLALVAVLGAGVLLALTASAWMGGGEDFDNLSVFVVKRGPLTIDVVQSGSIKNRDLEKVKNEVEGRNAIIDLVEEGTEVKKGDRLVKLDSSQLEESRDRQQIDVKNGEAAFIQAREKLAIARSQAQSDNDTAELDCKFAEMDLGKYVEGDYPQQLEQADADIKLAEESHKQAKDKWGWSRDLEKEGYVTRTELEQHELEATRKELEVNLAKRKLQVLKEWTHKRKLAELTSNVEQAKAALERTIRKSSADVLQAKVQLGARKSEYERQKERLEKLKEQVAKCTITAPVAGMVVYATTGGRRRWSQNEPLSKGQEVQQRQELIHLPVSTSMMAEAKVAESALRKVKPDQRVNVNVDAVPGKVFRGRVGKIALYPDSSSWMNPDLKVYSTEVYIDGAAKELRAGMNCEVQIIVEQHADALYIPIQAVVRVSGKPTVYVVGPDGPQPREVKIGFDNNRMIHILNGLNEGETVSLTPPLDEGAAPITETSETPVEEDTKPEARKKDDTAAPAPDAPIDTSKRRDMTPEQRRKFFENLTPEQRRNLMQGRRRNGSKQPRRRKGTNRSERQ